MPATPNFDYKPPMSWHNFATGKTDWRSSAPATDEEAEQYLPQWPEVINYYRTLRASGQSIGDASIEVLKRVAGFQEPA